MTRVVSGASVAGLVCLSMTMAGASEKPRFESQPRDGAITIDGRYDDWYGHLQPFEAAPVAVQFLNDREYLYMRLSASSTPERMEILRRGFTVWFDRDGGTKKRFGIRYPVVEHGSGPGDEGRSGGYGGGRHGAAREGEPDAIPEPSPSDRIDVLGPGKDDARMLTREFAQGVGAAIRSEQGTLQYELRVPLVRSADHPYAIEAISGKPVGVGLEAGPMPQHSFGRGGPGGGFGGGRGGGMPGGGMHRGGGDGGPRGGDQPAKPLKGWGVVTIAPSPAR